jgi:hypothetical protein
MQTNSILAAVVEEAQEMSFEKMKNLYPNEWVVVGNPVVGERNLKVISGIPLVHGIDKRIVCWEGRKALNQKQIEAYKVIYTGDVIFPKRFMTGIFHRLK